ncbi:hypothetical protein BDZ89DRAFT_965684, partial [Hymenopellis radicata]
MRAKEDDVTRESATSQPTETPRQAPEDHAEDVDESYGPKTAEVPDPTIYPSAQLRELIDIGSVPESMKEEVWAMLERNIDAFGFDGRLGHVETKAKIKTSPDQNPISAPMYNASPAKRAVIDAQLDAWFEQDVIEPSSSPWGAPVVIVYRNGKARF